MNFILMQRLSPEDIDFVNNCDIETRVVNYRGKQWHLSTGGDDSGWCDASSGQYVITGRDRVIFVDPTEQQATFLKLKYPDTLARMDHASDLYFNEDLGI